MHKLPWAIIPLALAALTLAGYATTLRAEQVPQGAGGTAFTCTPDADGGSTTCICKGILDCSIMGRSDICEGVGKKDDTSCGIGGCNCTLGGARVSPGRDLLPKAEAPATHNAPRDSNVRDHRRKPAATRRNHRVPATAGQEVAQPTLTPGAIPLTSAECTTLGGKAVAMPLCKGDGTFSGAFGKACVTTDQSGKPHAVCISKAKASSRRIEPSPRTSRKPSRVTSAADNTVYVPLTSQECKGLGGKVTSTNKCGAKGQQTCATVDKHGVIRVACIDKVVDD